MGLSRASELATLWRVSTAVTEGIRITVRSFYVPEQSVPRDRRYVFAYTVRIANEGDLTAQLRRRHWVITDGDGKVEEVRGDGVVGAQPTLKPGQHFEYTSGCVLRTARGTMHGTYSMHRDDGRSFEATIAPFDLALPHTLN
ncbi:MAG: Co2+/Mg2+ efflux protein ApaG [Polyangiales bacterium]